MSQLTLYNAQTEVTPRPLPQPLAIEWRGWPCLPAGRPYPGKVTARQEPRPTGWAKLPFDPFNLRPNQTKSNQIKAGRQPSQKPGAHRPPLQPEPFEALIGTNITFTTQYIQPQRITLN